MTGYRRGRRHEEVDKSVYCSRLNQCIGMRAPQEFSVAEAKFEAISDRSSAYACAATEVARVAKLSVGTHASKDASDECECRYSAPRYHQ